MYPACPASADHSHALTCCMRLPLWRSRESTHARHPGQPPGACSIRHTSHGNAHHITHKSRPGFPSFPVSLRPILLKNQPAMFPWLWTSWRTCWAYRRHPPRALLLARIRRKTREATRALVAGAMSGGSRTRCTLSAGSGALRSTRPSCSAQSRRTRLCAPQTR